MERPPSWIGQVFADETGWGSFSRVALLLALLFTFAVVVVDVWGKVVPGEAYAILTAIDLGLIAWAGGNRGLEKLDSMIKASAEMVASWRKKP